MNKICEKEFKLFLLNDILMKKIFADTKLRLDKGYRGFAPDEATICKWLAKFRTGKRNTKNDEPNGHPKEATNESIQIIHKIIIG